MQRWSNRGRERLLQVAGCSTAHDWSPSSLMTRSRTSNKPTKLWKQSDSGLFLFSLSLVKKVIVSTQQTDVRHRSSLLLYSITATNEKGSLWSSCPNQMVGLATQAERSFFIFGLYGIEYEKRSHATIDKHQQLFNSPRIFPSTHCEAFFWIQIVPITFPYLCLIETVWTTDSFLFRVFRWRAVFHNNGISAAM